jgi:3D (Asp-Asp-Asp) domain-containing protein
MMLISFIALSIYINAIYKNKDLNIEKKSIFHVNFNINQQYDEKKLDCTIYKQPMCKLNQTENDKSNNEESIVYETVYATQNVNIRIEDSIESESLGILLGGESVKEIEKYDNGWSKILWNKQICYIKTEYLTNIRYNYDFEIKNAYSYLGEFKITAYCDGTCCNGKWAGTTSIGVKPSEGKTIAVAPWIIPYRTEVYIEGVGTRIAQDTGGFANRNDHQIDLFFYDHEDTKIWGVQYRKVWIKK